MYRLYSWEHSYFSGKARAYLRFKARHGDLGPGFEDILATPELVVGRLAARSGSIAVPQVETPEGEWIQDSSDIIDRCESRHHSVPVLPDPSSAPRQHIASYLIELLADEWLVVPAFWQRWFFTEPGRHPNHRAFNEQQWGAALEPDATGDERRGAGGRFFETAFGISDTRVNPKGVYAGLVHLGCDERTERAWQASQHRLLQRLETHFGRHDYLFGGRPSLGDFGLLGPLYAHLYRDAVSGYALRTHFPLVAEWVERTNGEGALNARQHGQKLYSLDDRGELIGRPATSDAGDWLSDDALADSLGPILSVFFEEMWPVLRSAADHLSRFIASDAFEKGGELPGKTFFATPGFETHQTNGGALTHAFEIGGVESRRMVVPYQMWMLQRVEGAIEACSASVDGRASLERWLAGFPGGSELLDLPKILSGCRIRKTGGLLHSSGE